jgi:hypothetical protein
VTLRVFCSARMLGAWLLLPAAAFIAGCGPDTGGRLAVSGTVQFQDAPLQSGTIQFVSEVSSQTLACLGLALCV